MNRKILIAAFACVSMIAAAQSSSTTSNGSSTAVSAPRDNASGQASRKAAQKNGGGRDRTSSQPAISEGVAPATSGGQSNSGNMSGNHKDGWNAVAPNTRGNSGGTGAVTNANDRQDGNKTAEDSWEARQAASKNSGHASEKVEPADMNGDGLPDRTATPSKGSSRVATGDVNGDGHADVAASSSATGGGAQNTGTKSTQGPRDAASGQASGKRQHQPVTIQKEVDKSSPKLQ